MNSHEFTRLMRRIKTVKAGVGVWLKRIDRDRCDGEPTQADMVANWASVLANTNVDDAMRAVEDIGEEKLSIGRDWSRIPYIIRNAANGGGSTSEWKSPVYNEATREWTVHCLECDDIGMVTICRIETQLLARDNPTELTPKKFHTCAVACSCGNGNIRARAKKGPPQYNERSMCRITADALTAEEGIAVLLAWIGDRPGRDISEHPNHTSSFDAFNEGQF